MRDLTRMEPEDQVQIISQHLLPYTVYDANRVKLAKFKHRALAETLVNELEYSTGQSYSIEEEC